MEEDGHVELPTFTLSTANEGDKESVEHRMSRLETAMQVFKIILAIAIVKLLLPIYIKI